MADQAVLKRSGHRRHLPKRSATVTDRAVLKPRWLRVIPIGSSATMADQAVLKHSGGNSYYTIGSATMADRAVLKPRRSRRTVGEVQQPWQIERFSNLWVWICRLIWAFLFQRTAKSARSSCFCDPPDHFFDRALGSPQASIPALTAVWIHYSKRLCQVAISAER